MNKLLPQSMKLTPLIVLLNFYLYFQMSLSLLLTFPRKPYLLLPLLLSTYIFCKLYKFRIKIREISSHLYIKLVYKIWIIPLFSSQQNITLKNTTTYLLFWANLTFKICSHNFFIKLCQELFLPSFFYPRNLSIDGKLGCSQMHKSTFERKIFIISMLRRPIPQLSKLQNLPFK